MRASVGKLERDRASECQGMGDRVRQTCNVALTGTGVAWHSAACSRRRMKTLVRSLIGPVSNFCGTGR